MLMMTMANCWGLQGRVLAAPVRLANTAAADLPIAACVLV